MANVLRKNRRNLNGVYDAATSNGKKYVTDHRETITMIANLLEKCYGNSKATLCRESDWNELAHVRMKQSDVGWQHMLAARTELRAWVEGQVSKKELWTPPPSAELEQLEDLDIIDLTGTREDHEVQGGEVEATEEDGGDGSGEEGIAHTVVCDIDEKCVAIRLASFVRSKAA